MKTFLKTLFIVAALAFAPAANAQKFGHFDLDSLLGMMPELSKANEDAAAFYKQLEKQMIDMQTELDTKMKDYEQFGPTWSPSIKKLKEDEINGLNQRIQGFQMQAQTDFNNKKAELLKPIYDKINKAVKDIAKEKGYKYIFDSSKGAGILVYADPADDVFALLKAKLNIPNPAPKTPGTGGAAGGGTGGNAPAPAPVTPGGGR